MDSQRNTSQRIGIGNLNFTQSCELDSDGDGIDNRLDLDSDNDGCPDFVEAGGMFTDAANGQTAGGTLSGGAGSTVTTNLGNTVDTTVGSASYGVPTIAGAGQDITTAYADDGDDSACDAPLDTDGDGVPDSADLDDDNDGILDTVENSCDLFGFQEDFGTGLVEVASPFISGTYTFDANQIDENDYTIVNITRGVNPQGAANFGPYDTFEDHTAGDTDGRMLVVNGDVVSGELYRRSISGFIDGDVNFSFWLRNVIGPLPTTRPVKPTVTYSIENTLTGATLFTANSGDILEGDGWLQFSNSFTPPAGVTDLTFVLTLSSAGASGNDLAIDDILFTQVPLCDFDGDGVPNVFDLDSDNDGIYDVTESGGTDANNDGFADDDDDNADNTATDGIPTSAGAGNTPTDSGPTPGTPDYLDYDSDEDGCSDANEAYGNTTADGGDGGQYGAGQAAENTNGTVVAATYPATSFPADTNGTAGSDYQQADTAVSDADNTLPADVTTIVNATETFTSNFTGSGLTYQWFEKTPTGASFTPITDGGIYSGATTATLTLTGIPFSANGNLYRVEVSGGSVCDVAVTSTEGLLTVQNLYIQIRPLTDGSENNSGATSPVQYEVYLSTDPEGLNEVTNTSGVAITGDVTFPTGGTATSADVGTLPTTFSIADGSATATIDAPVVNDDEVEGTETLIAQISNPSANVNVGDNDQATGNIIDADVIGTTVSIEVVQNGTEDGDDLVYQVIIRDVNGNPVTNNTGVDITADVMFAGGATAADFTAAFPNGITIPDGASSTLITLPVNDDLLIEADDLGTATANDEVLTATLSNLAGGAGTEVIGTATADGSVIDNDTNIEVVLTVVMNGSEAGIVGGDETDLQYEVTLTDGMGNILTNATGADINTTILSVATSTANTDPVDPNYDFDLAGPPVPDTTTGIVYTIPSGDSSVLLDYEVTEDLLVEASETLVLTQGTTTGAPGLTFTVGGTNPVTGTISDNDDTDAHVQIVLNQNGSEGPDIAPGDETPVIFDILLFNGDSTNPAAVAANNGTIENLEVTVSFSIATVSNDDVTQDISMPITVSIAPGSGITSISLDVFDDFNIENLEDITATITSVAYTNPVGTTVDIDTVLDNAVGTITDNDNDIIFDVTVTPANGSEGPLTTPGDEVDLTYTVTLVNANGDILTNTTGGDIVADISFDPTGTATQTDFNTTFPTTISIPNQASDGSTTLAVLDDGIIEGDETLIFVADSNPANPASLNITSGNATGTVTDNDAAIVVVTATEPLGNEEGAIPGEFTVALVDAAGNPIVSSTDTVVTYTIDGTATNDGSDYTEITTFTVTIPAGSSEVVIPVPVIDDTEVEGVINETVVIDLTGVTGDPEVILSTTPADITATVEIIDNDTPPIVVIAMPTETITEDNDLTFTGVGGNSLSITDGDGQDQTVTINVTNGTLDLTDIPGVSIVGDGTGSITLSGNLADINQALEGAVFSPDSGFNGTATIEIETADASGNSDTVADGDNNTITINVIATPDLEDDDFLVGNDEDMDVTGNLFNDNGNGPDDLGTTITTVINNTNPTNGTVVIDLNTGVFTYTPNPNFNGTDTFTYTVEDANGNQDTATVTIVIDPVVDTTPDMATTDEDTPVDIDVLANDGFTGTYGTDYEITSNTIPANGTVSIDPATGLVTYTPNADFNGTDSFEYTVTVNNPDGTTSTETTTVDVVVNPVQDAIDDMASTGEDIPVTIDVSNNDTFSNPNSVITDVADPVNGSVILNADGTITYQPDSMFSGTDTFTYTVTTTNADGTTTTEVATVTVVIEEDSDEDGVPDNIDLDDDNDGITDLVEGGGVDGSADDDGDGVPNYLDDAPADPLVGDVDGMIETGFDTDMDGVPNHLDLDADNDGIFDVLEVGGTDGDNDGIADGPTDGVTGIPVIAGPGYTGTDSDAGTPNADGIPDFLDLDSDGDGCSDANEAFGDANADGGDGGSYGTGEPQVAVNPNGTVIGADYSTGTNADVITIGPDPDGDGIANTCDDDDDNDGNPDPTDPNPLAPTAVDDMGTTDVFTPVTIDIIGNDDFISNNDPLSMNPITIVEVPGGTAIGIIVIDETTGELTYTPDPSEDGPVTIVYQVCNDVDMDGTQNIPPDACDTATVTITVDGDTDGDGTPNGSDPDPNDPCLDDGTIGDEDLTNAIYLAGDCDGDGIPNGDELTPPDGETPTNPYDGCSYVDADQDYATTTAAYQALDCDGDGVTNGDEIDPDGNGIDDNDGTDEMDPCDYNPILVTLTPTAAFLLADCDGDGTPNGSDPDPQDPCIDDGTVGDEDATNPVWAAADCDGDGTPNGTDPDPEDPCVDDGTIGDEDATNPVWSAEDCDGDGTPNGTDPDPQDPCVDDGVTGDEDITNAIYAAADCDGDGTPNGTDPDPNDPCVDDGTVGDEDATNPIWTTTDCDGDGTPNGTDPDPQDPCVDDGTIGDEDATNPVWAAADCDGDGTPNGTDPDPNDPCVDDGTVGDEDLTNAIYAAADCDGDGTPNGTDPDPQDPCVDDGTVGDEDATNPIWAMADCDGDGDPNGNDPDPQDPCVFTAGSVGDPTNPIFAAADCDGDGTPNGTDPDPNDPCVDDGTVGDEDATNPVWAAADCDGDGTPNGTDPDPQDPCVDDGTVGDEDATNPVWSAADCDGDGTPNGTDPDPNDPCVDDGTVGDEDLTNAIYAAADCDGDGTPNGTDPDSNDPCVDDGIVGDEDATNPVWTMADCDGDGDPNGNDPDPQDPCVFTAGSVGDPTNPIFAAADCDGDGTPNGTDPDPNDPCVGTDIANVDLTNTTSDWALADCDGDGVTNLLEEDPNGTGTPGDPAATDSENPCDYDLANQDITMVSAIWNTLDCDGDGVINGDEVVDMTDPQDPCDYNAINQNLAAVSVTWNTIDCDMDGLTNAEEITGIDDPITPNDPNGNTTDPLDPDTDGDGVTDGDEAGDGTDPNDPCDFVNASMSLPVDIGWLSADCDGDGVPNGQEVIDMTDPQDPCSYNSANQDVTIVTTAWEVEDCDGDGVDNGQELDDMTDPQDSCSFNPNSQDGTMTTSEYDALDCDGDGVTNGQEITDDTNPLDPCDYDMMSQDVIIVTTSWETLDCDGDGVINGTELDDGTDPQDACDFLTASQTGSVTSTYENLDCDGDGVTNGNEIADGTDPNNFCDFNSGSQTLQPSDAFNVADCDGDSVQNEQEGIDNTDPSNPCDFDFTNQDLTQVSDMWLLLDCDGDSILNGDELGDENDNDIPDYLEVNNGDPNAPDGLEIFDIMTPNGDGLNDVFVIRGIEQYPNNTLRIYNRWGVKVYDVDGYGQDSKYFRGISEGRVTIKQEDKLPVGTYYYVLDYVNRAGKNVSKAGPLYINRR